MNQAGLARAFDEFTRLDGPSAGEPGVGLGLAIVRQMTNALGIEVEVRSTPGRGTVFTLWFR